MKRFIISIVFLVLTVASVASLMMRSVRADVVVFSAQLSAANEVLPPVTNADLNAFGSVIVSLDTTSNTANFDWSVNGAAASAIILSHIHEGAAGVNGPVRVDSGITPGTAVPVNGGSAVFSRSAIATTATQIQAIIANPAGFYFNIHSNLNPGGIVRGQLIRQAAPSVGNNAPTLSEWGAIMMGLLIVAACVFFLVGRGKASMALGGTATVSTFDGPAKVVDWKLLAKVTMYVEAGVALALVALRAGPTDAVGALTSGLLVAFIAHVFIAAARRR